ncbi:hypothetical protein B7C51_11930 [Paenibacillus larvae subsp. pulvifaciens]|uniref:Uncharacterized protein n=2 Tax=Paenibacillus larvae TaxID=1464 RepID=A0A1V0UST3_9BACL|nr:hypothetical protein B7C51_11930 [Paenibacillus larvae subsp. pulvifaciens]
MVGKIRITWAVRQISLRLAEPRHVKKDFEEELIADLNHQVADYIKRGVPLRQAEKKVISGLDESLLEQLKDIYRMKRFVYNWILFIALLFGFLGLGIILAYHHTDKHTYQQEQKVSIGIHTLTQNINMETMGPEWNKPVRDLVEIVRP